MIKSYICALSSRRNNLFRVVRDGRGNKEKKKKKKEMDTNKGLQQVKTQFVRTKVV